MILEQPYHILLLVLTQKTVIDKNATQLVANSLVHQCRNRSGVNSSTYGSKDLLSAHLFTNVIDCRPNKALNIPFRLGSAYRLRKVFQYLSALFGVNYFRMELNPVEFFVRVANSSRERILSTCQYLKALRQFFCSIGMAHPAVHDAWT